MRSTSAARSGEHLKATSEGAPSSDTHFGDGFSQPVRKSWLSLRLSIFLLSAGAAAAFAFGLARELLP